MTPAPFLYYGGKTRLAPQIASLLPAHGHYVEPFAGSLAVLLAKKPSKVETVNDLDRDLMNFWRVVRERPADLERACVLTPHSREEFTAAGNFDSDDDLERARRLWVRLSQGRSGKIAATGWRYTIDPATPRTADYPPRFAARLPACAERLRYVTLECKPALEVVETYGGHPDVLLYVDPPYLASTRHPTAVYRHEMQHEPEHRDLLDALLACKASVVLSGYASDLYASALHGWDTVEIKATAQQHDAHAAGGSSRTEVLWSNRSISEPALDLFGGDAA